HRRLPALRRCTPVPRDPGSEVNDGRWAGRGTPPAVVPSGTAVRDRRGAGMAFVHVRVVTGVLDDSEKQRLIEGITDLVVEVEGKGDRDFARFC
ncbi:MAG: tautomerase family protein, partial [Actinomycetota bacterium]|nr:tautomerase family protein [Actinomycetota bacterium]